MKNVINFLAIILIFFSFIQCSKNTKKDEYEIVNLILQKNVTAYGVKIFPPKKIAFGSAEHKKFNDSLINSGNLTYHIVPFFFKLDTLKYYKSNKIKNIDEYESSIILNNKTEKKIDFNKIKIDNFKRVDVIPCKDQYLDNCDKYFTFTFKISEIVINKSKAYVELNFQCGAKCGKGIKYELKKENGTWKIDKENLIWIS